MRGNDHARGVVSKTQQPFCALGDFAALREELFVLVLLPFFDILYPLNPGSPMESELEGKDFRREYSE